MQNCTTVAGNFYKFAPESDAIVLLTKDMFQTKVFANIRLAANRRHQPVDFAGFGTDFALTIRCNQLRGFRRLQCSDDRSQAEGVLNVTSNGSLGSFRRLDEAATGGASAALSFSGFPFAESGSAR